jgi:hypothetical protein
MSVEYAITTPLRRQVGPATESRLKIVAQPLSLPGTGGVPTLGDARFASPTKRLGKSAETECRGQASA